MAVNWTNITSFQGMLQGANTNTNGLFWTMLLFGLWLVVLLLTSVFGFETALLVSAFFAIILGSFFVYAELMAWTWLLTFVAIMLFAMLYIAWIAKKK